MAAAGNIGRREEQKDRAAAGNIKRREEQEDIAVAVNIKRIEEHEDREYKEKRGTRGHRSSRE